MAQPYIEGVLCFREVMNELMKCNGVLLQCIVHTDVFGGRGEGGSLLWSGGVGTEI